MCKFTVFHRWSSHRTPTNPATIRPSGFTVSPPIGRHLAPTSVQNTMHIIHIAKHIQNRPCSLKMIFLVKGANRLNQFSKSLKTVSLQTYQMTRLSFKSYQISFFIKRANWQNRVSKLLKIIFSKNVSSGKTEFQNYFYKILIA